MKRDKIQQIIEDSGNDFQHQVADFFESQGWSVERSPYYNDQFTDKPREIDIIAKKEFPISGFWGAYRDRLTIRLFIECKYIKYPIVTWFLPKNKEKAKEYAKDNDILSGKEEFEIPQSLHYLSDKQIIKSWAKNEGKDDLYDAWNQVLNALVFFKHRSRNSYTVDFPIIILDSLRNLYERDSSPDNPKGYRPITDNVQLEVDYVYLTQDKKSITKYFLIDIVSFEKIQEFLQSLDTTDFQPLKQQLINHLDFQQRQEDQWRNQHNSLDPYE